MHIICPRCRHVSIRDVGPDGAEFPCPACALRLRVGPSTTTAAVRPSENLLLDLMERWEEQRRAGHDLTPEELCPDSPELHDELRERIQRRRRIAGLLAGTEQPLPTAIPVVPGYEVLGELGRGGMGVVYRARDTRLNRPVALKMVLGAATAGRSELIRFLGEAEAVAALRHPHVVQIYEYGEARGRPFMALEYLPGGTLADRLKDGPPPARAAAGLLARVARGVAAAHAAGLVHRDLKPGNVLLDEHGEPKVTDFGLAKRAAGEDLTHTGAVLGTPSYMAPEQARGEGKFVGPPADVWALGVMLYEALTGTRPFTADSPHAVLRKVVEDEPPPPSRFGGVPRDLEAVCLKCLEKDPQRRYAGAAEVANDLERYLAGKPVTARPAGWAGRAAKWAARKPYQAATLAFAALAVGLVVVGSVMAALWREASAGWTAAAVAQGEAENARDALAVTNDELKKANREVARRDYLSRVNLAGRAYADADLETARRILDECDPTFRDRWEWRFLDRATRPLRTTLQTGQPYGGSPGGFGQPQALLPFTGDDPAQVFALSPDARNLAFSGSHESVLFEVASGKRSADLPAWKDVLIPMGRNGSEARYVFAPGGRELFVWRRGFLQRPGVPRGNDYIDQTLAEMTRRSAEVGVLTLHPDKPPTPGRAIPLPPAVIKDRGIVGLAAPPDRDTLLIAQRVPGEAPKAGEADARPGKLVLTTLSRADGSTLGTKEFPFPGCLVAVFAPAADRVAFVCHPYEAPPQPFAGGGGGFGGGFGGGLGSVQPPSPGATTVRVVDLKAGTETLRLTSAKSAYGQSDAVKVAFDPTGTRVALVSTFAPIAGAAPGINSDEPTVWDALTGTKLATLNGTATALAFAPDGRLVTGGNDGWLRVWDVESRAVVRSYRGHGKPVTAISVRGTTVASVGQDGITRVWDLAAPPTFQPAPLPGEHSRWMRVEGPTVAQGGSEPRIIRPDGTVVALEMKGKSAFPQQFSRDRKRLLGVEHHKEKPSRTDYHRLTLWGVASGRVIRAFEEPGKFVGGHALSPDGALVAVLLHPGPMRVFDAESGDIRAVLELPEKERMTEFRNTGGFNQETGRGVTSNGAYTAGFSPDGRVLVSYHQDRIYRCWEVATGQLLSRVASGQTGLYLGPIEFLPDGRLITADEEGVVHLWNPTTGAEVPTPLRSIPGKGAGSFDRDGSLWVRAGLDGNDRLYDAASGTELLNLAALGMQECRFTPGGELFGYCKVMGRVQFDDVRAADRFPAAPVVARPGPAVQTVAVPVPVRAAGNRSTLGTLTAVAAARLDNRPIWFIRDAGGAVEALDGSSEVPQWTARPGPGRPLVADEIGQVLAAGGTDGTVSLLDPKTGKVARKLEGPPGVVDAIAMVSGGYQIAAVVTADKESTVRLWGHMPGAAATPPVPPVILEGVTDARAAAMTFHLPEGEKVVSYRLATAHADGSIRIWNMITRKEEFALKGHEGPVTALAFTRDGFHLASLGADRTVRLWDLKKREAEKVTLPHPGRALVLDEPAKAAGTADDRVRVTVLAGEEDGPVGWLWVWDRSREGPESLTRASGGWAAGSALAVVPPPGRQPANQVLTAQAKNGLNIWSLPGWTPKPDPPMKP